MKRKPSFGYQGTNRQTRPRRFAYWISQCGRLCRCGGFDAQLDGLRLHVQVKHFQLLTRFIGKMWLAWSTPGLFVRFVPEVGEYLYWQERKKCESALGSETTFRLMGDSPIDTSLDDSGRLWLPPEIAERAGIPEGCAVRVVFRRDSIEVWKADRLIEVYCHTRDAISKMLQGRLGIVGVLPAASKRVPSLPVYVEKEV